MHTYFLESSYNGANGWPTIVIPSVPDPSLAPCGHHVLHATMASSYREWANLKRGSDEYEELKRVKGEVLMDLVRQVCLLSWPAPCVQVQAQCCERCQKRSVLQSSLTLRCGS
jgi:hypothetical protein